MMTVQAGRKILPDSNHSKKRTNGLDPKPIFIFAWTSRLFHTLLFKPSFLDQLSPVCWSSHKFPAPPLPPDPSHHLMTEGKVYTLASVGNDFLSALSTVTIAEQCNTLSTHHVVSQSRHMFSSKSRLFPSQDQCRSDRRGLQVILTLSRSYMIYHIPRLSPSQEHCRSGQRGFQVIPLSFKPLILSKDHLHINMKHLTSKICLNQMLKIENPI